MSVVKESSSLIFHNFFRAIYWLIYSIQEKRELTKLTSTISINIDPAEKEFLSQPDGEKPDSAKVCFESSERIHLYIA